MEQQFITKINNYIKDHLKTEFTLDELAAQAGYTPFHLTREYKAASGYSVMEYVRMLRIRAAAEDIGQGAGVYETAVSYCFGTHAGFDKAFYTVYGITPSEYIGFAKRKRERRDIIIMDNTKIKIRLICKDDVQDLWENVYSAMTPRQITEDKILPMIKRCEERSGIELVAEVEGRVVMTLPMIKQTWLPMGIVFDNNYRSDGAGDIIMKKLLEELIRFCRTYLNISVLIKPSGEDDESSRAFEGLGFSRVFTAGGWDYLMLAVK